MNLTPRPFLLITVLLALQFLVSTTNTANAGTPTFLGIWSPDYVSPDIVDPLLGPTSIFTLDVNVTDIPPVVDEFHGGMIAFDIRVAYDPAVLKATSTVFKSPECPLPECLFDPNPLAHAFVFAQTINTSAGTIQLAVALANQTAAGSGTLFRIVFEVQTKGYTTIDILETVSQIIGPVSDTDPFVQPLPYQSVDGSFDNRDPFSLSTNPPSAGVGLGATITADVNVYLVWKKANFTDIVSLTASGQPPDTTVILTPDFGVVNFTSQMAIATSATTPRGSYQIMITATSVPFAASKNFTLLVDVRDVAVTAVTASPTFVTVGEPVTITATVANQGSATEKFSVLAVADFYRPCQRTIGSQTVSQLAPGQTATTNFVWDTTGTTCRTVSTRVEVSVLPGEDDTADNSRDGPIVTVNRRPTADFSITPNPQVLGQAVQLDASHSSDPDGTIETYEWLFGDGSTASEKTVTHTYDSAGTYNVTLTITDNDGDTATTVRQVTISATPGPQSPASPLLYGAIGAVALVVLAAALLFFRRRARKPPA